MNYKVSVTRTFSAAHALRGYQGRCERLHGHNWKIRVALASKKLDRIGMVVDFTEMRSQLDGVLACLDHRFLNEVPPFDKVNPTAENIAAHIFNRMKKLMPKGVTVAEVEVWESDTSSATVSK